ncbi:TPA: phosphoadenosine phosphosulfate reductase family protein [Salmonella enterica subsp. enterica serovar Veneziana]|nr:phosphoadenosine phosphosulfate reductase [Salmonella enterica subsp. enterica serovar Aba]EEP5169860.1 phosphoadenosine phosphosulfate reductase family protein [Salmonella enterica subsp. enterica serovar Aba]HBJ6433306.1 phosphoadenosine phosphosulfate reductase family protein [Salmonella enterica subsp. enterica serovar Veneziana]
MDNFIEKLTERQKQAQRQSMPLEDKIAMTKRRIKDFYEMMDGDVYCSFSGGKDSTVLRHIIKSMGLKMPFVFSNTGLEMPEIVDFVRKLASDDEDIVQVRPKVTYNKVWQEYGLPIGSKKVAKMIRVLQEGDTGRNSNMHNLYNTGFNSKGVFAKSWKLPEKWRVFLSDGAPRVTDLCCDFLKKEPLDTYAKGSGRHGISAIMADEGGQRETRTQCNVYEGKRPNSAPMLFWLESDVWEYIKLNNVEICEVYFDREVNGRYVPAEKRTGCMFCGFGAHLEKGMNRFQRMAITHPRQHSIVIDRMGMGKALDLINVKYIPDDED